MRPDRFSSSLILSEWNLRECDEWAEEILRFSRLCVLDIIEILIDFRERVLSSL